MENKEFATFTDEQLLEEAKKTKLSPIVYALMIGFLAGVIFYSVAKNTWGLITLIPLFLIYKLLKDSKKNEEFERILKERGLK